MKIIATAALAAFLMTSAMPVFAGPAVPAKTTTTKTTTTKTAAKPAEQKGKITKWSATNFTLSEGTKSWTFLYSKKAITGTPKVGANADVWYTAAGSKLTATKVVVSAAPAAPKMAPKMAPKAAPKK